MSTFIEKIEAATTKIKEAEKKLEVLNEFVRGDEHLDKSVSVTLTGFKKGDETTGGTESLILVFKGQIGEKDADRIISQVARTHKNIVAEAKKELRALCRKKNEK